jgi:AraC-like DNA-binding protein
MRGTVGVQLPGFGPIVVSVVELRGIQPHLAPILATGASWMLIVLLAPARLSVFRADSVVRLDFPSGSAILMPHHTRYRVDTRPARSGSHHFWMQIENVEKESRLLAMLDDETGCARFSDPSGALVARLAVMVEAVEQQRSEPFWVMQAYGRNIIHLLSGATREADGVCRIENRRGSLTPPDHLVDRSLAFMKKNISQRIRLEDLAQHLHASVSTISHRYRAATGEAPIQTLHRMRMLQAKRLLVEGSSLRQIAEALGFYDEHHFSRAFKKGEGLTPLQFAQQSGSDRPMLGPTPK